MLVTTLTKKMAEDLTDYLLELGIRVRYLHSEVDTLRRVELLRELRQGEFDVLVGHQPAPRGPRPARGVAGGDPRRGQGGLPALRHLADPDHRPGGPQRVRPGPHVRGQRSPRRWRRRSTRPTAGARSRSRTTRRTGIDPQPLRKKIVDILDGIYREAEDTDRRAGRRVAAAASSPAARRRCRGCPPRPRPRRARTRRTWPAWPRAELADLIQQLNDQMLQAARELQFELAARLRDEVGELKKELRGMDAAGVG